MATTQTPGIVLRKRLAREQDRVYVVYTKKFGKLELIAQGASKIQSKLAGHLEPFSVSDLFIAHGKVRDRVAGSIVKKSHRRLKSSWTGISLASFLAETTDLLCRPYHQDQRIFDTLENTLAQVDRQLAQGIWGADLYPQAMAAALKIISYSGYQPFLDKCVIAAEELTGPIMFSPRRGGFICPACARTEPEKILISSDCAELLRQLLKSDIDSVPDQKLGDKKSIGEAINIIYSFLENVSETQVLTKRFIKV